MRKRRCISLIFVVAALAASALVVAPATAARPTRAVYTMTNSAAGNEVLVFSRMPDGTLSPAGAHSTGGAGTGSGLGNQGGLVLSDNNEWLFVVNAGSDSISSFAVASNGLDLRDTQPSNGDRPISLTVHGQILYVLNDQSGGNVTGFRIFVDGTLEPIPGSTQPIEGQAPAQIEFSPDGSHLVVTEKDSNTLAVYPVANNRAQPPVSHPSSGQTPFGFAFDERDHLIVSEAFGGAPDASAVSSYDFNNGAPDVVSPSVPTTETAACWIVITDNNRFAYTTNTGSASITGYRILADGSLVRLDEDGVTGATGAGPIDMALARNSRFLYSLDSGAGQISAFAVNADGSLTPLGATGGLPASANGLAAT